MTLHATQQRRDEIDFILLLERVRFSPSAFVVSAAFRLKATDAADYEAFRLLLHHAHLVVQETRTDKRLEEFGAKVGAYAHGE